MIKRFIASFVIICFIANYWQMPAQAQDFSLNQLPVPGKMVSPSAAFTPLSFKGLVINPKKPLEFQFIVDTGKDSQDTAFVKEETNRLVKYFLAGLTIPEGDLWVNLSPYEKDRITPQALGQTDLGRDLLAEDYILKQLTASLIYPEKDLGKEFWSKVYKKAQEQFGTTNIPVNTFNKVWILPDQAQVFENGGAAYVTQSTLKVMLDEDYLAKQKHTITPNDTSSIGANIIRQIVIPEITKEVNTGRNFAPLRQIYQALILAKWYKETVQNGLLDAVYTNKNKVQGVNLTDPAVKEQIYSRYLQAYKKGVFNYIKEDATPPNGQATPRKYFSGGTLLAIHDLGRTHNSLKIAPPDGAMLGITIGIVVAGAALVGIRRALKGKTDDTKKEGSLGSSESSKGRGYYRANPVIQTGQWSDAYSDDPDDYNPDGTMKPDRKPNDSAMLGQDRKGESSAAMISIQKSLISGYVLVADAQGKDQLLTSSGKTLKQTLNEKKFKMSLSKPFDQLQTWIDFIYSDFAHWKRLREMDLNQLNFEITREWGSFLTDKDQRSNLQAFVDHIADHFEEFFGTVDPWSLEQGSARRKRAVLREVLIRSGFPEHARKINKLNEIKSGMRVVTYQGVAGDIIDVRLNEDKEVVFDIRSWHSRDILKNVRAINCLFLTGYRGPSPWDIIEESKTKERYYMESEWIEDSSRQRSFSLVLDHNKFGFSIGLKVSNSDHLLVSEYLGQGVKDVVRWFDYMVPVLTEKIPKLKAEASIKKAFQNTLQEARATNPAMLEPVREYEYKLGVKVAVWSIDPQKIQPHILVAKGLEGKLYPVDRRSNSLYWQENGRKTRKDKNDVRSRVPAIKDLKEEFLKKHPELEIVAVTGNENLFYNAPIVTVVGKRVYHAIGEDVQDRSYPMYVVWPDGHVSIEEKVTFRFLDQMKREAQVYIDDKPVTVGYATVIQLIKNENGFVSLNSKNNLKYFYDDIKHLFLLPMFGKEDHGVEGLMSDGVLFMADQFLADPSRIEQFFANPKVWQQFNLTATLIDAKGIEGKWSVPPDLLKERLSDLGYKDGDDFRIEPGKGIISIRLKESVYPFHIVGVTKEGKVKEIAVNGQSSKKGVSIREAAELAEKEGLIRAGIIDQGTTVRLDVNGRSFANTTVDKEDPLGQQHASSIIIYTRKKNAVDPAMLGQSLALAANVSSKAMVSEVSQWVLDNPFLTWTYVFGASSTALLIDFIRKIILKNREIEKLIKIYIKKNGEKNRNVIKLLIERLPALDLVTDSIIQEVIDLKDEGYDFKVIHKAEVSHMEDHYDYSGPAGMMEYGYQGQTKVIDSPETLYIERGDKLPDPAMLGQTSKQFQDAAMAGRYFKPWRKGQYNGEIVGNYKWVVGATKKVLITPLPTEWDPTVFEEEEDYRLEKNEPHWEKVKPSDAAMTELMTFANGKTALRIDVSDFIDFLSNGVERKSPVNGRIYLDEDSDNWKKENKRSFYILKENYPDIGLAYEEGANLVVKEQDVLRFKKALSGVKEALSKKQITVEDNSVRISQPDRNGVYDSAMSHTQPKYGGIDLNQINVNRTGKTIKVEFDPAQVNELLQGGFEGFSPVIIKITPISSPFPLLGVNVFRREEERLAKI